jgi:hypothetical protein
MKHILLLVLLIHLIEAVNYAKPKKTYTGKNCEDCLLSGKNHCLLKKDEGLCCDQGDPTCRQTANDYDPNNPCSADVNNDMQTSYFTCPTATRCPTGNTNLYLMEFNKNNGFSDSWGWFQYIYGSVCKFRIWTGHPKSNLILEVSDITDTASLRIFIMSQG